MGNLAAVTLNSSIQTDRKLLQNASNNIALRDVEGYTQKTIHVKSNAACNPFTVTASLPERYVNKMLQSKIRDESSVVSGHQVQHDYLQSLETVFGPKGAQATFVHEISKLADTLITMSSSPDPVAKSAVIHQAVSVAQTLTAAAKQIQDLRTTADREIGTLVTQCNETMGNMAKMNGEIYALASMNQDITTLEDSRDLLVQTLTDALNIPLIRESDNQISLGLSNGSRLVSETFPSEFQFTPASGAPPGVTLSPLLLNGVDIGPHLQGGRLHGLLKIRDTILPNFQAQLDEVTRHLRDTLNAVHNLGTPAAPRAVVTGTAGVPGLGGPLQATTDISGTGTVRLAALDAQGTIQGYKDIPLSANMTVDSLINAINTATVQGGGSGITAALTAEGELRLNAPAGYGVAVGNVTGSEARMTLGTSFNGGDALGFSHFFGLNNLFQTGPFLASPVPQTGLCNEISVRSDLTLNPNFLCAGQLSSEATPPLSTQGGLPPLDTSIALALSTQVTRQDHLFEPAGLLPGKQGSLLDYASLVVDSTQAIINATALDLEKTQLIYTHLSNAASHLSAVDPSEVLVTVMEIASSQNLTSKSLSILLNMDRDLSHTLAP